MGLHRVGLDRVAGYLQGGMPDWINRGMETGHIEVLSIFDLQKLLVSGRKALVLDNRLKSEWDRGHIEGTLHVPFPAVRHRAKDWSPEEPVATLCNTSNRSILAASLLKQRGFQRVSNVVGGTTAWEAAGLPFRL